MKEMYQLDKVLWTDADFELMSWHDCPIKAQRFDGHRLLMDIGYMFKWILKNNKRHYQFWISPCTLEFEYVSDIDIVSAYASLVIDNISRTANDLPSDGQLLFNWLIDTTAGEISFKSTGYKQYVRQHPILISRQELDMSLRGGISFSNVTADLI